MGGRSSLEWTLSVLDAIDKVLEIIVAPCSDLSGETHDLLARASGVTPVWVLDPAPHRMGAISRALAAAQPSGRIVIHEIGRPQSAARIAAAIADCDCDAIVTSVPVKSTFKLISGGVVKATVRRQDLVHVQGPLIFDRRIFEAALARSLVERWMCVDELELARRAGITVRVVARDRLRPHFSPDGEFKFAELAAWPLDQTRAVES